jgi:hypothetical protein
MRFSPDPAPLRSIAEQDKNEHLSRRKDLGLAGKQLLSSDAKILPPPKPFCKRDIFSVLISPGLSGFFLCFPHPNLTYLTRN